MLSDDKGMQLSQAAIGVLRRCRALKARRCLRRLPGSGFQSHKGLAAGLNVLVEGVQYMHSNWKNLLGRPTQDSVLVPGGKAILGLSQDPSGISLLIS